MWIMICSNFSSLISFSIFTMHITEYLQQYFELQIYIYKRITGLCDEGLKLNFDCFNKRFWGKCSQHYLNKNKTLRKMKIGYNIKQQYTRNFIRKGGYKIEKGCSLRFGLICVYLLLIHVCIYIKKHNNDVH